MRNIVIVGDFRPNYRAHLSTEAALAHSSAALACSLPYGWIGTEALAGTAGAEKLTNAAGVWIAPGSPYKSMDGALLAIRTAREHRLPLLGTCGGFQHLILEYARNVLGYADAQHEETAPEASRLFISRLTCSLAGHTLTFTLQPDSMVARIYGRTSIREPCLCNFGVNPAYAGPLSSGSLHAVGSDVDGQIRVVELVDHPFFVGTLFVPQLASTSTSPHPLISAFVRACQSNAGAGQF